MPPRRLVDSVKSIVTVSWAFCNTTSRLAIRAEINLSATSLGIVSSLNSMVKSVLSFPLGTPVTHKSTSSHAPLYAIEPLFFHCTVLSTGASAGDDEFDDGSHNSMF